MSTAWPDLEGPADDVARRLLGCVLERTFDDGVVKVMIVETEAYHQSDAASHSYKGKTPRTDVMFGPAGFLYVYFTYGMHYCCNIVTGEEGEGAAVLIRAVEPLQGEDILRREGRTRFDVTNGPAKLCQALAIDKRLNGHNLLKSPLKLHLMKPLAESDIITTPRIGIKKAIDMPWRFYIRGNNYVSK
ncbi:MAG TPA: DNA-3-methyladenine glycosylase [Candidatus Saccharimonadales bacterium]|nr:DNA-3-methyladenine glycosylase [Candidatus Saccharimonadales bacterium]